MPNPGESTGPLSIDQAVAALELPRKEQEAPAEAAPAKEEPNSPAEPTAEDTSGAETPTDGEATAETPEAEAEAEQPGVEPPKFWDADAKERFKALPPDVQEIIVRKEDERNKATVRALQEAAEKQRTFDAESAKYATKVAEVAKALPNAKTALEIYEAQFNAKWANVDWIATQRQLGYEAAQEHRFQMEADKAVLEEQRAAIQRLEAAKNEAEAKKYQKFVAEEESKLAQLAPELTDSKLGNERKQALGKFLLESGVPAERIPHLTAIEASIAYDAMKWRNGNAKAKQLVNATPTAAPVRKTPAKPPASSAPGSTQSARIEALSRKRELTVDELVELRTLKGPT